MEIESNHYRSADADITEIVQSMMEVEVQKLMSLEGIHIWAAGVIQQATSMDKAIAEFSTAAPWRETKREFERSRHFFLLASQRLTEHIDWAQQLDFLESVMFADVLSYRDAVKYLRNKNEHVVEYFSGEEKEPEGWWHEDDGGKSDASATVDTKIGGRLDWKELSGACARLLAALPKAYFPTRHLTTSS